MGVEGAFGRGEVLKTLVLGVQIQLKAQQQAKM